MTIVKQYAIIVFEREGVLNLLYNRDGQQFIRLDKYNVIRICETRYICHSNPLGVIPKRFEFGKVGVFKTRKHYPARWFLVFRDNDFTKYGAQEVGIRTVYLVLKLFNRLDLLNPSQNRKYEAVWAKSKACNWVRGDSSVEMEMEKELKALKIYLACKMRKEPRPQSGGRG